MQIEVEPKLIFSKNMILEQYIVLQIQFSRFYYEFLEILFAFF